MDIDREALGCRVTVRPRSLDNRVFGTCRAELTMVIAKRMRLSKVCVLGFRRPADPSLEAVPDPPAGDLASRLRALLTARANLNRQKKQHAKDIKAAQKRLRHVRKTAQQLSEADLAEILILKRASAAANAKAKSAPKAKAKAAART